MKLIALLRWWLRPRVDPVTGLRLRPLSAAERAEHDRRMRELLESQARPPEDLTEG